MKESLLICAWIHYIQYSRLCNVICALRFIAIVWQMFVLSFSCPLCCCLLLVVEFLYQGRPHRARWCFWRKQCLLTQCCLYALCLGPFFLFFPLPPVLSPQQIRMYSGCFEGPRPVRLVRTIKIQLARQRKSYFYVFPLKFRFGSPWQ